MSVILAYEVLSDRFLRAMYNAGGLEALEGRHAALIDLLGEPQGDVKAMVHLDLEEVATGVEKRVRVEVAEACTHCGGLGAMEGMSMRCMSCEGEGFVSISTYDLCQKVIPNTKQRAFCPKCGGTGHQIRQFCTACHGSGLFTISKFVRVTIPQGIMSGTMLIARGRGSQTCPGNPKGDLYIGVIVRKHRVFSRIERDIYSTLDVPLFLALLGGELQCSTVWGEIELAIESGIQHGETIVAPNQGIKTKDQKPQGKHFFKINIVVPHADSFQELDSLRSLQKLISDEQAS